MKFFIKSLLTFLIVLQSTQTFSQQLIPFQARLTDSTGAPVSDGVYSINFAIYDMATGGTPVNGWVESHATVSVMSGVVNVILGSITPLNDPDNDGDLSDAVTFYTTDGNRFIGVTIGAGQEMVPRHQLVPSFHAATADTALNALNAVNAATLDGNPASFYASNVEQTTLQSDVQVAQTNLQVLSNTVNNIGPHLTETQVISFVANDGYIKQTDSITGTARGLSGSTLGGDVTNSGNTITIVNDAIGSAELNTSPGSTGTWDVNPDQSFIIPEGIYVVAVNSLSIRFEMYTGYSWVTFAGVGGFIWSDGVNMRIREISGDAGGTAHYRKMR